jgi:hypothetical protein
VVIVRKGVEGDERVGIGDSQRHPRLHWCRAGPGEKRKNE